MRLVLIATLLPPDTLGGAEAYVEAAATSLSERHEVVVLTGSRRGSLDGVPVLPLPRLPLLESGSPLVSRALWHARDQWLPSVHLAVAGHLRRLRPDVVVTHHPQGLSSAVFTAVGRSRSPHVHIAHDLNLACVRTSMTRGGEFCGGLCLECRLHRRIRRGALRTNIARLVAFSRYICARHVEAGFIPADDAEVIRLGARPGRTRVRRLRDEAMCVGFIGTLAPYKGVLTLLRAFERAPGGWRLVLAGTGPLERQVAGVARRDSRVSYRGRVQGLAKDAFFDELDLVVIPSEWEEPATLVAVEAAVRGIPTVVSDRGGLPEAPEARTFRSREPDALLRAIRWFADEPRRLEETSARLLANRRDYEWGTHVERMETVLETVLAEETRGGGRAPP